MPTPEQSEAQEHDHVSVPLDLEEAIRKKVLVRDKRFEIGAYLFLYEALAFTQKVLGRDSPDMPTAERHVTGQELLDGIRQYAAARFGPLAPTVFRTWGLERASDFGEIVFNLVKRGLLGKTDKDRREDFAGGFDFNTAFDGPLEVRLK